MKRTLVVLTALFLWAVSAQATLLKFDDKGTNVNIRENWGSRISDARKGISVDNGATPNVTLSWSSKTNDGHGWQFYNDDEWTAAQMDGFKSGAIFDLLFTPDPGYSVQVLSFVFDDYDGYRGGSALTWQLFKDDEKGDPINWGTEKVDDRDKPEEIFTGMNGPYEGSVLLRLIGGDGNDGKDEALDSINFIQADAVPTPEPATILLLGAGLIGLAGFGRKKFKRE